MRTVRFVALGDSLTEGVGDPVGEAWRGWAALLADGLAGQPEDTVEFTNLDKVYAAFTAQGAVLLTACLPDPGAMLGLPGALARPLARRQRAVNTVVHALSERYGAVHLHAAEGEWIMDRAIWSADRLHPGERGHRQLALRFHALLAEEGVATGVAPSPEPEFPAPTKSASLWWLATAGTGWVARRCTDLLPQLLGLAADEMRHRARGTSARLDLSASHAVSAALAALSVGEKQPDTA